MSRSILVGCLKKLSGKVSEKPPDSGARVRGWVGRKIMASREKVEPIIEAFEELSVSAAETGTLASFFSPPSPWTSLSTSSVSPSTRRPSKRSIAILPRASILRYKTTNSVYYRTVVLHYSGRSSYRSFCVFFYRSSVKSNITRTRPSRVSPCRFECEEYGAPPFAYPSHSVAAILKETRRHREVKAIM